MSVVAVCEGPRVLLVEDSVPVRQRLRSLIEESGRAQVVGESGTVADALAMCSALAPDAVVLDLHLSDGTSYAVLENIKRHQPACLVIVMTNFAIPEHRHRCALLQVDHFLEKSADFELVPELLARLRLSPQRHRAPAPAPAPAPALTPATHPEQHYRHLVETLEAAVYTCDATGHINFYNAAASRLWGRTPVIGREQWCGSWRMFELDGEPLAAAQSPLAIALREGRPISGREVLIERPNGERAHVLLHPKPLFDGQGQISGGMNMLLEITPAQQPTPDISQATLDSFAGHICVLDEAGVIVAVNRAWRRFGAANQARAECCGVGASYLGACEQGARVGSDEAASFADGLRKVLAGHRESFEEQYACHGPGQQRWFVGRVTALEGSKPLRVVVAHLDITPRKLAEQALRESQQRWQFAIEASGDGIWDADLKSQRTIYSPRWKAMLGYADHEIGDAADEWASRVHPDDRERVMADNQACLDSKVPAFSSEFRMRCKDGRWKWVLDRGIVVSRNSQGQPLRMTGMHSDISARKDAEAANAELEVHLRESQKMEAVGTLAGTIAHDFNNIMGAILGNVALAQQDLPGGHPAVHSLAQIHKAGLRARSLVQKILSFARHAPLALSPQPLAPLVQESLDLLRATLPSGVTMRADLAEAPLCAEVDATQLSQVLINLGTNAWHALLGRPGEVKVGLAALAHGGSGPLSLPAGHYAHLWVSDSGCGMDASTRARIFEPFFTTKAAGQGTGLGLAVVRSIVQAHRGEIVVDSAPGAGSCFHVYLPLATASPLVPAAQPAKASADPALGQGQHVLYIDDDEAMTMLVARLLPRSGFRVTCTQDAQQALDSVAANPLAFDLVVADFNMPRLSGLDVARAVYALRPGLPLIITSGSVSDDLIAGARRAGVRGLVNKERAFEELVPELLRVLAQGRPAHREFYPPR